MAPSEIDVREAPESRGPRPRGVLDLEAGRRYFDVSILPVSTELADLVQHFWAVHWDVRGQRPYRQHTLSNPSFHLVVERGRATIQGVVTGRFTRVLQGTGSVFGVRFRPAGFRPFAGSPAAALADHRFALSRVFGRDAVELGRRVEAAGDDAERVPLAEAFLRARLPAPDPVVPTINGIVERIASDRTITRVDDLVSRTDIGKRTLQRLFREYVGVSPKWVIQRQRLHEAEARLAAGEDVDLAALALELGYFDQAHFARDFKAIVGRPPAAYARGSARR